MTPEQHNANFDPPTNMDWLLFTLIPGKLELQLPPGFGIPARADTKFDYYKMTLNQNEGVDQQHEEEAAQVAAIADPTHSGEQCA